VVGAPTDRSVGGAHSKLNPTFPKRRDERREV
jgi:hypothetical protein